MNVRDTSIQTYKEIINEGLVGIKQIEVLEYLAGHPDSTDKEISVDTGMDINCVTGRRNELVDFGVVIENGKRPCKVTDRTVYQWKLNPVLPSRNRLMKAKEKTKELNVLDKKRIYLFDKINAHFRMVKEYEDNPNWTKKELIQQFNDKIQDGLRIFK